MAAFSIVKVVGDGSLATIFDCSNVNQTNTNTNNTINVNIDTNESNGKIDLEEEDEEEEEEEEEEILLGSESIVAILAARHFGKNLNFFVSGIGFRNTELECGAMAPQRSCAALLVDDVKSVVMVDIRVENMHFHTHHSASNSTWQRVAKTRQPHESMRVGSFVLRQVQSGVAQLSQVLIRNVSIAAQMLDSLAMRPSMIGLAAGVAVDCCLGNAHFANLTLADVRVTLECVNRDGLSVYRCLQPLAGALFQVPTSRAQATQFKHLNITDVDVRYPKGPVHGMFYVDDFSNGFADSNIDNLFVSAYSIQGGLVSSTGTIGMTKYVFVFIYLFVYICLFVYLFV